MFNASEFQCAKVRIFLLAYILVPKASVSFGHVVGEPKDRNFCVCEARTKLAENVCLFTRVT